jgi:ribonuclease HII
LPVLFCFDLSRLFCAGSSMGTDEGNVGNAMSDRTSPRLGYPTLDQEQALWAAGYRHVVGLDEAGRGAWAGPVVAAAVMVPPGAARTGIWAEVRDSKLLSPAQRARLAREVQAAALAWGVGVVAAPIIDQIGIGPATRQAMLAALAACALPADYLLIDWVRLVEAELPQCSVAKADQRFVSVAAASIVAKVARDRLLVALDGSFPGYGFATHKGYGTAQHRRCIGELGPCDEHRHSFAPIAHAAHAAHAMQALPLAARDEA